MKGSRTNGNRDVSSAKNLMDDLILSSRSCRQGIKVGQAQILEGLFNNNNSFNNADNLQEALTNISINFNVVYLSVTSLRIDETFPENVKL